MMILEPKHLFIHIVTHEFIIGYKSELPDYVPILSRKYIEDYSSEYEDLGPIIFEKDRIYIDNMKYLVPIGSGVSLNDINPIPFYKRFYNWIFG